MTVINTPEEAHLLPVGTIIRTAEGKAAVKVNRGWSFSGASGTGNLMYFDFPAIVVFTPEEE